MFQKLLKLVNYAGNNGNRKFYVVVSIGHSGTKWLANALNLPEYNMICWHEKKINMMRQNWKELLQHEAINGVDSKYDIYIKNIKSMKRKYKAVGDSNSWQMLMVPELAEKVTIDMVVCLVRNGIQAVHSSYHHNLGKIPDGDWLFTDFFYPYWRLSGEVGGTWENYTPWQCWCLWWKMNEIMPDWLAGKVGSEKVCVYRFEDLLQRSEIVLNLINSLNPSANVDMDYVKRIQKRDVNRKIKGERTPECLWPKWTKEQQTIFKKICGSTMRHYGYQMPE